MNKTMPPEFQEEKKDELLESTRPFQDDKKDKKKKKEEPKKEKEETACATEKPALRQKERHSAGSLECEEQGRSPHPPHSRAFAGPPSGTRLPAARLHQLGAQPPASPWLRRPPRPGAPGTLTRAWTRRPNGKSRRGGRAGCGLNSTKVPWCPHH